MINKFQAVHALVGGQITGGENLSEYIFHDGQTPPTEEQIQAKIAELQADYDAKQYQRDRKLEYPTIEELVVALYDEEDKASIIERRNAVKAKYPKPE
jgi:hypothetical protein